MKHPAAAVLALLGAAVSAAQSPPRSGQLFVSPMGEPFLEGDAPEKVWFANADTNHDDRLTRSEFIADATRFFATLDVDRSGAIGPAEIDRYEREVLPEIGGVDGNGPREGAGGPHGGARRDGDHPGGGMGHRGMNGGAPGGRRGGEGSGRPPQAGAAGQGGYSYRASGAGRFGYIATPEPVTAADTDLDRSVTRKEFVEAAGRRFELLDANGDGVITAKELPKLTASHFKKRDRNGAPPAIPPEI